MALTDKQKEHLQSLHSGAADIQRWAMQQLAADRVSRDRCRDINATAKRLGEVTSKLQYENEG